MDSVTITDLEIWTHIGVPSAERAKEQRLLVTVIMQLDASKTCKSDNVEQSVNYDDVTKVIREIGKTERKTIEKLGSDIAETVLKNFSMIEKIEVTIRKMILPGTKHVSFFLTRP